MDQLEATALALQVMKQQPMASSVDLARSRARFVNGAEVMEEVRRQWSEAKLDSSLNDYWLVEFPLVVPDFDQREWLAVTVDPSTKIAEMLLDL